jgi:hypothetical protein
VKVLILLSVCLLACGCRPATSPSRDAAEAEADVPEDEARPKAAPVSNNRAEFSRISQSVHSRSAKLGYEKLSRPEQVFLTVRDFEFVVNNGGFGRFYSGPAGDRASETVRALETIGAKRTAELVKTTNGLFGANGPSPDRAKRQAQLVRLPGSKVDELNDADKQFSEQEENLDELLMAFVAKNRKAFESGSVSHSAAASENAAHNELPMTKGQVDLIKISESVWDRESKLGYEKLSQPERVFLCVWDLEAEVNNGGFDQYYFNSAGDHALDTVRALETIGAKRTAELVRTMNNLFGPAGPSPVRFKRQDQLSSLRDSVANKMHDADKRFYKYDDNLEQLLTAFVSKDREAFRAK